MKDYMVFIKMVNDDIFKIEFKTRNIIKTLQDQMKTEFFMISDNVIINRSNIVSVKIEEKVGFR